jgi:micrococcal nuclease
MHTWILLMMLSSLFRDDLHGRVVGISDGDTFTLLTDDQVQVKVRLHGIDAPEKGQAFGQAAKKALSGLVYGHTVMVTDKGKDRYGRTIGMVYADDRNINEEMLRLGMAWHYLKYDKDPRWDALERVARESGTGLWSQTDPMAPWEWRAARRTAKSGLTP